MCVLFFECRKYPDLGDMELLKYNDVKIAVLTDVVTLYTTWPFSVSLMSAYYYTLMIPAYINYNSCLNIMFNNRKKCSILPFFLLIYAFTFQTQ